MAADVMSDQDVASRRGRPPRLNRTQVVAVARQIAADEGVESLTMRRLGDALGVVPNALYTYFDDKAAILDAVLDELLADVKRPGQITHWQNTLVSLMASYRRVLLAQPGLIALTVSRPMYGQNALRLREDMLTLLRQGGLADADAVTAFLTLFAYTTGFVVFETSRSAGRRDNDQRAQGRRLHESLPEDTYPSTKALAEHLANRPSRREFIRGLQGVIAGFTPSAK